MKKFKVITSNVVFTIGKIDYIGKKGDILELPDEHITTRVLLERKRIVETIDAETSAQQGTAAATTKRKK